MSIERLFVGIRKHLGQEVYTSVAVSPYPSKGLWPRLRNLRHASQQVGDVHHIVGDAHYLAFGLPPRRLVLTIHDCGPLYRLRGLGRIALRYFWFTGPMRRAAVVTTISEAMKAELKRWVGSSSLRVRVIHNCVGAEFQPTPRAFESTAPVVLQVGTGWNKNIERVAEALRGTPCRLEVVGCLSSSQRTTLAATGLSFKELGRLSDADLLAAYQRCDFVAFASLYEGFGLPILEAQAVGRPVITSNCGSMPEVAGQGACLVDPNDTSAIRRGIMRLIGEASYRNSLIAAGFGNVKRFQPDLIASRYRALYREVLTSRE